MKAKLTLKRVLAMKNKTIYPKITIRKPRFEDI